VLDKQTTAHDDLLDTLRLSLKYYYHCHLLGRKGRRRYFRSYCNRKLAHSLDKEKGGYLCIKCTIQYWPSQQPVKRSSHFEVPAGSDPNMDKAPPVIIIDDTKEVSSTTYRKQKLTESYKALEKAGFHFTNYSGR
jgi:hypothetical protein